jgi:glycosyltransferase involved in cell wall biosynthesis
MSNLPGTPCVSILIPVYNRERYIGPCVESALAQTSGNLEVVIVDNYSTDRTWEICRSLAGRDVRVRIFRNDRNIGPVANWRRCAEEARGELAKFLFSDDTIKPSFLEQAVPFLEDPLVGLVITGVEIDGKTEYGGHRRNGKISRWAYLWNMMFNGRLPVSPGAALLRTRDLRRNLFAGFGHDGIGPDLLLLLLTGASRPSVVCITEPLAVFHDHPGSISRIRKSQLARGYAYARLRFWLIWLARAVGTQAVAGPEPHEVF